MAIRSSCAKPNLSSFRGASLGASPESILPIVVMDSGLALRAPRNDEAVVARASILARRVLQHLRQTIALHPRDVVLVFEKRAQRVADHLRGQRAGVEFGQRGRPVDGLGDT